MKKLLFTVAGAVAISGITTAQSNRSANGMKDQVIPIIPVPSSVAKTSATTCSDTLMNFPNTATLSLYTGRDWNELQRICSRYQFV